MTQSTIVFAPRLRDVSHLIAANAENGAIDRCLGKKPIGHASGAARTDRRVADNYVAVSGRGTGKQFAVNLFVRLLVDPDQVHLLRLQPFAALLEGLESDA